MPARTTIKGSKCNEILVKLNIFFNRFVIMDKEEAYNEPIQGSCVKRKYENFVQWKTYFGQRQKPNSKEDYTHLIREKRVESCARREDRKR